MIEKNSLISAPPLHCSTATLANAIRALAMDAVEAANSGHPGMPMGMADIATVLVSKFLKFDAAHPNWPDRDRLILSNGHGSMLLYALLYLTGYEDMTLDQIKTFRQWGSKAAGHPEHGEAAGIEVTTGPLGQGLANSVGMALGERILKATFGNDLVNHKIYVMVGDGCLMEGISEEAISLAGHLQLNNLIVLFDDNQISIDGPTDLTVSDDQLARFQASNWNTVRIDGHNFEEIERALTQAQTATKPTLIACRTQIGKGAPHKAGTAGIHGAPLGAAEIQATRETLSWSHDPFVIPDDILKTWRAVGKQGNTERLAWETRLAQHPEKAEFERRLDGNLPAGWEVPLKQLLEKFIIEKPLAATRVSSQWVLDVLSPSVPELIGGSADLTGSNNTKAKNMTAITPTNYEGNYIHYGVREHAMGAAMNGLALHGGIIPYGGTFLVFSDYCRPAIRLSALMGLRVIYVMTHDSIGLGEDGPTHQPIEHLASLRAMPNLLVFRPADAVEVGECWALALKSEKAPSLLALTRQNLPLLRENASENLCAKGGYILKDATGIRQITLLATGSEVHLALKTREILEAEGLATAVVSFPCWELFDKQPKSYQDSVLDRTTFRVAIEAASPFGWERYVGEMGLIIGMDHFGASAPAEDLYRHFGFAPEDMARRIKAKMTQIG